jgi:transposase
VPTGALGPRLQALLAVLAGGYCLGKRPIRQLAQDLFGLSISTGMVAKLERSTAEALQQPMAELEEYIRTRHASVDETSWREAGQKAWLRVVVAPLVTLFHIAATRCGKVAGQLLGSAYWQVVTSDRWKAYHPLLPLIVSYGYGTKQVNEDRWLVRYLARHRHTTPFEMVEFKFHYVMPIFVARQ